MALDRDAERVLEMVRLSGRPPYETLTAPEARALFLAAREVLAPEPPPVAEVRELSVPGQGGVPVRVYRGVTTRYRRRSSISTAAAGSSAISIPMTASAGTSPTRPDVSSSRWITAWLPSINSRQPPRIVLRRRLGWPQRPKRLASTASA
jgi:hypothetical protein